MKTKILIAVGILFTGLTSATLLSKNNMQAQTDIDALSHALGLNVGGSLKNSGFDTLNAEQFVKGLMQALEGEVTPEQSQQSNAIVQTYLQEMQQKKAEVMAKEGTEFLAANANKEGVVTLPSGLQYKVIKAGTGPKAVDGDQVTTHYTGRFIDGKVFDSSVERGQPATFGVNQVIAGWTEALKLMPEGSKWVLYIPYNLAYGERGQSSIPPYSTLIFDIELIDVVGK
jgi:FKBP-type peptidyl-prolyl cis-trans isomerase FklB